MLQMLSHTAAVQYSGCRASDVVHPAVHSSPPVSLVSDSISTYTTSCSLHYTTGFYKLISYVAVTVPTPGSLPPTRRSNASTAFCPRGIRCSKLWFFLLALQQTQTPR